MSAGPFAPHKRVAGPSSKRVGVGVGEHGTRRGAGFDRSRPALLAPLTGRRRHCEISTRAQARRPMAIASSTASTASSHRWGVGGRRRRAQPPSLATISSVGVRPGGTRAVRPRTRLFRPAAARRTRDPRRCRGRSTLPIAFSRSVPAQTRLLWRLRSASAATFRTRPTSSRGHARRVVILPVSTATTDRGAAADRSCRPARW